MLQERIAALEQREKESNLKVASMEVQVQEAQQAAQA